MLASTTILPQGDPTEDIGLGGNSTAPASSAQESEGGARQPDHPEAEQPAYYLYFLVCAATTGDQRGLFKLGITNHLPTRYRCNTWIWDEFDLYHSALLVGNEMDLRYLERYLKKRFKKWQRHPGRADAGYTEFFAVECLAEMLTLVQAQSELWIGAHLSRGIDPAECELSVRDDGCPPLTKEGRRELRARQDAAHQRAVETLRAQYEGVMAQVLAFALAHEQDLLWVDLRLWHQSREMDSGGISGGRGLIDLYFERTGPAPSADEIWSGQRSAVLLRLEEDFAPIAALVASMDPEVWGSVGPTHKSACHLQECNGLSFHWLPHRSCVGKPLLRLESTLLKPFHPLFEQFEALAERVQNRSWTQLPLLTTDGESLRVFSQASA